MKVIQSLWTKPLFNKESSLIKEQGRFSGGWLSNKYFTMAITVSVLSIKKQASERILLICLLTMKGD